MSNETEAFADGDIEAPKPKRTRTRRAKTEIAAAAKADVVKEPLRAELRGGVPNPSDPRMKRIRIILEENPNIPRGGQFFCVNGYTALIKPGREVRVPEAIVDVLNNAVEKVAIKDENTLQVIGYKDSLRYPYRNLGPAL